MRLSWLLWLLWGLLLVPVSGRRLAQRLALLLLSLSQSLLLLALLW